MAPTQTQTPSPRFNPLGYALPLAGAASLLAGVVWAVYKAGFSTPNYILIGVGLLLFLSIFVRAERANMQYYLHVIVYSLLVGGICVVAYLFASLYTAQVDLTKQNLHSLSEATRKYLKGLDQEVTISIMIPDEKPFAAIRELYNSYTDKLTWKFVDPVKNPVVARDLDENVNKGEIFFQAGTSKKRISAAELDPQFVKLPVMAENTFTNAIIDVTRKNKPKLYFLSGHGEVSFTAQPPAQRGAPQTAQPSLAGLRTELEKRGNQTEELDLVTKGAIPRDATAIVIAGPRRDLFDPELAALAEYLRGGGKLLALIDPMMGRTTASLTNLKKLIGEYGVEAPDSLIVDLTSGRLFQITPPLYPLLSALDTKHPITRQIAEITRGVLALVNGVTRPLVKGTVPADMEFTELVKSSPESWSTPLAELSDRIMPPPASQIRAQTFGVAVGKLPPPQMPGVPTPPVSANNTRLTVFGTSMFAHDAFLNGNDTVILLMLNSINWLTESEDMIAIPPRRMEGTPIVLQIGQQRVILMIAVILLPAVLFFGGVSYSVVRRRR